MKKSGMCSSIGMIAGAALFCASALGQGQMGGMQQQQTTPNAAQTQGMNGTNNMNNMGNGQASPADMEFVKDALQGSMAEVQTAQLVLQKSTNDQVKQFAQRMITDHTKLIDQMKPIAQQIGVKIPSGPDKKQKAMMAKLQALSGPDFDKAYVQDMVKDHKMDLSDFKSEIATGQSPAVKNAASQGEPVIQSHLDQIQGIAKNMNAGM